MINGLIGKKLKMTTSYDDNNGLAIPVTIIKMEKGRIVIIAGGTGNPFFTTDSAAALRANELGSEILLKGTKVDGVYDKDPHKDIDAKKYNKLSYNKVIRDDLRVMDMTAITLCHENNIPIKVFNIKSSGDLIDIISGSNIGTTIGK